MAGLNTLTFTDGGWDNDVLKSEIPVLVDFWATWCAPCIRMTPIIDQLADDYSGKVKIGKINVDENGQTAVRYRVASIPTMMLFKDGKVVGSIVGGTGKSELQRLIDQHVGAKV